MCKYCKKLKELKDLDEKEYKKIINLWKLRDFRARKLAERALDYIYSLNYIESDNGDYYGLEKALTDFIECSYLGK